jgi:hypothetical protein
MPAMLLQSSPAITGDLLPWITTFVVAVIGAVAAAMARRHGRAEQKAQDVRVHPSPLSVEIIDKLATKEQLDALEHDIKERLSVLERFGETQRRTARESETDIHKRIDFVAEKLSAVTGELKHINENLALVLSHILQKPRTTR